MQNSWHESCMAKVYLSLTDKLCILRTRKREENMTKNFAAILNRAGFARAADRRWYHPALFGRRLFIGPRVVRVEFRKVTPGRVRQNLRGSWTREESFDVPKSGRSFGALLRRIVRQNTGKLDSVRSVGYVGVESPQSVRSHAISGSVCAGGGKLRGLPGRRNLGWS